MACFIMPVERIPFFSLSFPWVEPLYCDYRGHTRWPFVGFPQGGRLPEPLLPWEDFVFHVIFAEAEAQSNQNMTSNGSMGHPISWGNGIILPHIYLVEPISEALHFWSTFRSWYNLRRAHSALQLSKHCFVFFSPWELLPSAFPQGERSRASCVGWMLTWEAGKASGPSWLI